MGRSRVFLGRFWGDYPPITGLPKMRCYDFHALITKSLKPQFSVLGRVSGDWVPACSAENRVKQDWATTCSAEDWVHACSAEDWATQDWATIGSEEGWVYACSAEAMV